LFVGPCFLFAEYDRFLSVTSVTVCGLKTQPMYRGFLATSGGWGALRAGEREAGMTDIQQFVMYEEEFQLISKICENLQKQAMAKVVYVVDKNGQLIAACGETDNLDTTSLASLTAGNIAATGGLAKLIGEKEFATQFHEGERDNFHISIVGSRAILVVIFDNRTNLGLVRLRVRKSSEELEKIFKQLIAKMSKPGQENAIFSEITDADIDNLFSE
jgi:predicted regulator of Ras-like GTPase activity (Roadblock/LC7/MglB family)